MTTYGYARVSTAEQDTAAQVAALVAVGVDAVGMVMETVSGAVPLRAGRCTRPSGVGQNTPNDLQNGQPIFAALAQSAPRPSNLVGPYRNDHLCKPSGRHILGSAMSRDPKSGASMSQNGRRVWLGTWTLTGTRNRLKQASDTLLWGQIGGRSSGQNPGPIRVSRHLTLRGFHAL